MSAIFSRRAIGQAQRDTAITVVGGFWAQALILVSGVLVARILGVENRGHLALLWVVAAVLSQLGLLGLPLAVTYWIAKRPASARAITRLLAFPAAIQAGALVGLQALVLTFVVGDEERVVRVAAFYTLGVVPAILAQQYALAILQGQRRFRAFNVVRVMPATFYGLGILGLFLARGGDLPTVARVWTSTYLLAGALILAYALSRLPPDQEGPAGLPRRSEMVRFGLKGLLGSASPLDTFQLDQAVVGLLISPAALGLYVVALAFTNLPRLVAQNIGFVAFPRVAERSDRPSAHRTMRRFTVFTLVICGLIVAMLEVMADRLVSLFFGAEFSGSAPLARILLISALLAGVRRVLADGVRGTGRPGLGTLAEIASWVSLVLVLPVLVPAAGVEGVAVALVTSSAIGLAVLIGGVLVAGRGIPPQTIPPPQADVASQTPG